MMRYDFKLFGVSQRRRGFKAIHVINNMLGFFLVSINLRYPIPILGQIEVWVVYYEIDLFIIFFLWIFSIISWMLQHSLGSSKLAQFTSIQFRHSFQSNFIKKIKFIYKLLYPIFIAFSTKFRRYLMNVRFSFDRNQII